MNILVRLKVEQDLEPVISAYEKGCITIAIKRFNKLITEKNLMRWEAHVLQDILKELIKK